MLNLYYFYDVVSLSVFMVAFIHIYCDIYGVVQVGWWKCAFMRIQIAIYPYVNKLCIGIITT